MTDSYEAALIKINNKGKIVSEEYFLKEKISRFDDSVLINDNLYVVGVYGNKKDTTLDNDSIVVTYDNNLEKEEEKEYVGDNTYTLNKIINVDNTYLVVGNTNSKLKVNNIKTNGLDYYEIITK